MKKRELWKNIFYLVVGNNNKKNSIIIQFIISIIRIYKSGQQHTTVKTIKRAQTGAPFCSQ